MSKILNKQCSESVVGLERLVDGIHSHLGDDGFPAGLQEDAARCSKSVMEEKRQNYEMLAKQAERAYDDFAAYVKESNEARAE
jgi:N-acyl-L-homoserine lactone synthetase